MRDPATARRRGVIKFAFWAAVATVVATLTVRSYTSGQMGQWFYSRAAVSGYAVNVDPFWNATKTHPAELRVVAADEIRGAVAVRVEKGARLPRNTNGVIGDDQLAKGRRASVTGSTLKVLVPWELRDAKGFKFKDSFKHKGIETWPWIGVWNVVIVLILGLALGLMAEGFTDMLGLRLDKLHNSSHH